jgi:hypothetical protein
MTHGRATPQPRTAAAAQNGRQARVAAVECPERIMRVKIAPLAGCVLLLLFVRPAASMAEPVTVRFAEAPVRGVLVLRSLDGNVLAHGDLIQTAQDGHVTSQVVFRFNDGSVHDETAVFSQNGSFRLLSYHLVQRGPSFRWTLVMMMNTDTGRVVVRHRERAGEEKTDAAQLRIPPDVANGIVPVLLKNLAPTATSASASFIAATPGPRPVTLAISDTGTESVSMAGDTHRATHYVIKADIGGLAGLIAPLVGRQPPDTHVWILDGPAPRFVKSEGPLFYGGPIWRIELIDAPRPASATASAGGPDSNR